MKKISFWVLLCLMLFSFQKDLDTEFTNIIEQNPPVITLDVSGAVQGKVVDESGNPITDALISLGVKTVWSNKDGLFKNNLGVQPMIAFQAGYRFSSGWELYLKKTNGRNTSW